ncbi:hypothetical protein J2T13_000251 [Paenibacillus sp. DS2015]
MVIIRDLVGIVTLSEPELRFQYHSASPFDG